MSKEPLVSVIIPVKQLTYYLLHENLPAFERQTYQNFEVIVLPNEHAQYDLVLFRKYKKLRIIPTGKITRPAQKRDIGVKEAKGEIIAFIDDDAYPDPAWLANAVALFKKHKKVEVVCGPGVLPAKTNVWEKIFDEVLKTWIGAGSYRYRFARSAQRFVTDYPTMNFLIYRKTFQDLGGFNSDYWPGEDSKLCNDLIRKNPKAILYDPGVLVHHHRRNDLKGYLTQHASYGYHRGAFFAHGDTNSREPAYLVPTAFILYLVSYILYLCGALILGINQALLIAATAPLLAYGLFVTHLLLQSFINTKSIVTSIGSVMVLFLTHVVYGVSFIKGFRRGLDTSRSIYE